MDNLTHIKIHIHEKQSPKCASPNATAQTVTFKSAIYYQPLPQFIIINLDCPEILQQPRGFITQNQPFYAFLYNLHAS